MQEFHDLNSRDAVGFGDAALGGARGEFDVDWVEGVVRFEPGARAASVLLKCFIS